jgi:hypothetical protein
MLPDTLGTETFMKIASLLKVKTKGNVLVPFLYIIGGARQDSGTLENFVNIMQKYNFNGVVMASEIENTTSFEDINKANEKTDQFNKIVIPIENYKNFLAIAPAKRALYTSFGAGGFFGDSEKAWDNEKQNISMAVKAVRIKIDGVPTKVKPLKLGDSNNAGKLEVDGRLSKKDSEIAIDRAVVIRDYARYTNNDQISEKMQDVLQNIFDCALIHLGFYTDFKNIVESKYNCETV